MFLLFTPYSDIPEGCVLFGPRDSRFCIFSDNLFTILHAMHLVSNKVASNQAKITTRFHILFLIFSTAFQGDTTSTTLAITSRRTQHFLGAKSKEALLVKQEKRMYVAQTLQSLDCLLVMWRGHVCCMQLFWATQSRQAKQKPVVGDICSFRLQYYVGFVGSLYGKPTQTGETIVLQIKQNWCIHGNRTCWPCPLQWKLDFLVSTKLDLMFMASTVVSFSLGMYPSPLLRV